MSTGPYLCTGIEASLMALPFCNFTIYNMYLKRGGFYIFFLLHRLALKVARYGLSALLFLSFVTVTQGPLLLERDPILAENLLKVCKEVGGGKVVAVLGMAHLNGVAERLKAKGFQ